MFETCSSYALKDFHSRTNKTDLGYSHSNGIDLKKTLRKSYGNFSSHLTHFVRVPWEAESLIFIQTVLKKTLCCNPLIQTDFISGTTGNAVQLPNYILVAS
jgi:hypothetical protein